MTRYNIKPGDVLIEGNVHYITVTNIIDNYIIEYFEDDYFHETKIQYITGLVIGQKSCDRIICKAHTINDKFFVDEDF